MNILPFVHKAWAFSFKQSSIFKPNIEYNTVEHWGVTSVWHKKINWTHKKIVTMKVKNLKIYWTRLHYWYFFLFWFDFGFVLKFYILGVVFWVFFLSAAEGMMCHYIIKPLSHFSQRFFSQIFQSCNRDTTGSFVCTQSHNCSHRITTELRLLQYFLERQIVTN